jgi:hypothetical protein
MTGQAKLRIALSVGLALAVLCVIVALHVGRVARAAKARAASVAHAPPASETAPEAAPSVTPGRAQHATHTRHVVSQPDTAKPHKTLSVERVITSEDFKRLPVLLSDLQHGDGLWFPKKWSGDFVLVDKQDLEQAGSLERALGRSPGIVFRQTDPP